MGFLSLILSLAFGAVLVWLVWRVLSFLRQKPGSMSNAQVDLHGPSPDSADIRLQKLNALLAQGLIKESEYQKQRASIIADV